MLALVLVLISALFAPKVEPVGPLTESTVAEPVKASLDAKGLRVLSDDKAICEVWFRKEVPTEPRDVAGALFAKIPDGTFVGVMHFPSGVTDYRGQPIKAGYYTLRYGLMLEDGNHLGVSPTKDFLLICPVSEDKDPNQKWTADQTIKMSRVAAGAAHPSPWSLQSVSDTKTLPKVITNEHEHLILETTLTTKSGPMQVGLVVVGKTEG